MKLTKITLPKKIIIRAGRQLTIAYLHPKQSSMVSTNDVYRKIKEISKRYANPRPQVTIELIAQELRSTRDQITTSLAELKYLRLIQYENYSAVHVKLTLLGYTVNR